MLKTQDIVFSWLGYNDNDNNAVGGGANESCGLTCRLQVAGHFLNLGMSLLTVLS